MWVIARVCVEEVWVVNGMLSHIFLASYSDGPPNIAQWNVLDNMATSKKLESHSLNLSSFEKSVRDIQLVVACYFSSCHNLKDCNVIFYDCQTDSTGRFLKTLYIATNKHNYFKALRRSVYTSFMPILQPLFVLDMISKFKVEKPFFKGSFV